MPWLVLVANASNERLTRFEYPYSGKRQRMINAAQVANCVQVVASNRIALLQGGTHALSVRSEACEVLRPTHSLPPGRRWNIWHGMMPRRCVKRVRRTARALATSMGHVIAV